MNEDMDVNCVRKLIEDSLDLNNSIYESLHDTLDLLEDDPGSERTKKLNEVVVYLKKALYYMGEYREELEAHIPKESFNG